MDNKLCESDITDISIRVSAIMESSEVKTCSVCKVPKPINSFSPYKQRSGKPWHRAYCRTCGAVYHKEWEAKREAAGLPFHDREKEAAAQKQRYREDPVYRERILAKNRERRKQEPAKATQRTYERKKMRENLQYRLGKMLRSRLTSALNGTARAAKTMTLLGCPIEHFIRHIESLFQPGMTWGNQGMHGWHIDHIIPCVAFDLTRPEEQCKCFHWTNMQPLWAFDNISKHDYVPDYQI